jgi:hypothetical protein
VLGGVNSAAPDGNHLLLLVKPMPGLPPGITSRRRPASASAKAIANAGLS